MASPSFHKVAAMHPRRAGAGDVVFFPMAGGGADAVQQVHRRLQHWLRWLQQQREMQQDLRHPDLAVRQLPEMHELLLKLLPIHLR